MELGYSVLTLYLTSQYSPILKTLSQPHPNCFLDFLTAQGTVPGPFPGTAQWMECGWELWRMTQHEAIREVWERLQQPSEGSYFFFEAGEPHQRAEARVCHCTVTHREFRILLPSPLKVLLHLELPSWPPTFREPLPLRTPASEFPSLQTPPFSQNPPLSKKLLRSSSAMFWPSRKLLNCKTSPDRNGGGAR